MVAWISYENDSRVATTDVLVIIKFNTAAQRHGENVEFFFAFADQIISMSESIFLFGFLNYLIMRKYISRLKDQEPRQKFKVQGLKFKDKSCELRVQDSRLKIQDLDPRILKS